jgi:hypothetical protein
VGEVVVLEGVDLLGAASEEVAAEAGNPMNFGFHKAWKKRGKPKINPSEIPLII